MVKLILSISIACISLQSIAITEDELRKFLGASEAEHKVRSKEIRTDQLTDLLPAQKQSPVSIKSNPNNPPPAIRRGSDKSGQTPPLRQNDKATTAGGNSNNAAAPLKSNLPPSWVIGSGKVRSNPKTDKVKDSKRIVFGIRIGTTFKATLKEKASNADQGLVEIIVDNDVYGDFKTLRKGTRLYYKPAFNSATNRMDLTLIKGRDGKFEFGANGKAIVKDLHNTSGLSGVVNSDKSIINRSVSEGAFNLAGAASKAISGNDIVGEAVAATSDSFIDQSKTYADKSLGETQYLITVQPQSVLVKVTDTF